MFFVKLGQVGPVHPIPLHIALRLETEDSLSPSSAQLLNLSFSSDETPHRNFVSDIRNFKLFKTVFVHHLNLSRLPDERSSTFEVFGNEHIRLDMHDPGLPLFYF